IGSYSEAASSSARICAFLARLRARLQSEICAASRASLMKLLILETRSDCAAFRFFPRADSRFFSAMLRLWFVCCWATADSCGVSCGAIIGGSGFSAASFPVVAEGGALTCGRGGAVRTVIRWSGKGGNSSSSSGGKSSEAFSAAAVGGCVTGLTCISVAQGILGRLLMLHPPSTHAAQQRRTITEWREPRGNTIRDRTGFSVMFRPRVATRFGTSCRAGSGPAAIARRWAWLPRHSGPDSAPPVLFASEPRKPTATRLPDTARYG